MTQLTQSFDRGSARRIALAAQGFADPTPAGRMDIRHFRRVISRMSLLQLDSVQAVCRSHYLPVYSRLGSYDRGRLDRWLWHSGEMFETWSHEASVLPVTFEPLLRWRKERTAQGETWGSLKAIGGREGYVAEVLTEVKDRGPVKVGELVDPRPNAGTWWGGRSDGRLALDWLFRTGQVGVRRNHRFERCYETFDAVVPMSARAVRSPSEKEAQRSLLLVAARCHGVGTAADLADYFRIRPVEARPLLEELVNEGQLVRCAVEGWPAPAYAHPGLVVPRRVKARALLSPFDPLVWFRPRVERLFGFRYRIEIYVPEKKREFGYYVLPFLLGDRLVGRVDVKADRAGGILLARGVFVEGGEDRNQVAGELSEELDRLAGFLGLDKVVVGRRGNLASALRKVRG
ncbi:MAG: crosslink repair DNA glycosylase YcaQ family protein [Actinomycetota bacterium]|nr:crosslink repair DNA glycosylase YcaQ family protein [Actinomycetota bacterium]